MTKDQSWAEWWRRVRRLRKRDWALILGAFAILWLAGRGLTDVIADVSGW